MRITYQLRSGEFDRERLRRDLIKFVPVGKPTGRNKNDHYVWLNDLSFIPTKDYAQYIGSTSHPAQLKFYQMFNDYYVSIPLIDHNLGEEVETPHDKEILEKYIQANTKDTLLTILQSLYTRVDFNPALRLVDEVLFNDIKESQLPERAKLIYAY